MKTVNVHIIPTNYERTLLGKREVIYKISVPERWSEQEICKWAENNLPEYQQEVY